jgi:hypothetical protein
LVESIEKTVAQLLSSQVAEALFKNLERTYSIKKDEIPNRLDALVSILEDTFGESTKVLGKAIAKRFYSRLGLEFSNDPQKTLIDYIEKSKKQQPEQILGL